MKPALFSCPTCGERLAPSPARKALSCAAGHSFDIARQGYVSLMTGSKTPGDSPAMVQARDQFLVGGTYEPVAAAILESLRPWLAEQSVEGQERARPRLLADLGGGTGWYAGYLLDHLPDFDGVLVDSSVAAAKLAARAHPRLAVATADLWKGIPLPSGAVDLALVVFAPRNPSEIARILAPAGLCLVVTPTPNHLRELRDCLPLLGIEAEKPTRLRQQFASFVEAAPRLVEYQVRLTVADVARVVAMGPNAFHLGADEIATLAAGVGPQTVTVSVTLQRFRRPLPPG